MGLKCDRVWHIQTTHHHGEVVPTTSQIGLPKNLRFLPQTFRLSSLSTGFMQEWASVNSRLCVVWMWTLHLRNGSTSDLKHSSFPLLKNWWWVLTAKIRQFWRRYKLSSWDVPSRTTTLPTGSCLLYHMQLTSRRRTTLLTAAEPGVCLKYPMNLFPETGYGKSWYLEWEIIVALKL